MESIKELRVMLQTNVLGHPILQRKPSIYITRMLLFTPVTSIQVSAAMIIVGVSAGVVAALGNIWMSLVLIYISLVLDAVDGEIVRYKKTFSMRGVYLELVYHLVVFSVFFLGFTFTVSEVWTAPNLLVLVAGTVGVLSIILRHAIGDLPKVLFIRPYSERPELFHIPAISSPQNHSGSSFGGLRTFPRALFRKLLWSLHELHEGGYLIITLVITYAGELILFPGVPHHPVLSWVVLFYGMTSCLYLIREIIGGFYGIENRIALLKDRAATR